MKIINSEKVPAAIGPYSQAVLSGGLLFVSGQLPIVDGELVDEIKEATRACIMNAKAIIEKAGGTLENVVKTTVLMRDINQFAQMNEVYADFFSDHKPARAAYQVANLPKLAVVEIEFIAEIK